MFSSVLAEQQNSFVKNLRVYYEDTDAGGVVYHANYLNFMERCRCDWLNELGFNVAKLQECFAVMFVVREANISYDTPARLFDELAVSCRVLQVGKVRLVVQQSIYNGDTLVCHATIKLATLDSSSFKLRRMPSDLELALKHTGESKNSG
jgi:acyl-CoA thioester hydrolase